MGNAQARRRLNAKDFQYIANNTALLNMQMVTEYFNDLTSKYPDGKMDVQDFKKIFQLAFPERKEAKVDQLAEKLRNVEKTDGTIRKMKYHKKLILGITLTFQQCSQLPCFFSGSLTEFQTKTLPKLVDIYYDNIYFYLIFLVVYINPFLQMFKLFDEDGNGNISIDELLNMMAFFIELGMDTGNVDMAKTMAEVFSLGDINKDDKLSKVEFVQGMKSHPVMSKIMSMKTIDALLDTF